MDHSHWSDECNSFLIERHSFKSKYKSKNVDCIYTFLYQFAGLIVYFKVRLSLFLSAHFVFLFASVSHHWHDSSVTIHWIEF